MTVFQILGLVGALSFIFIGGFVAGIAWIVDRQEAAANEMWERIQVELAAQAASIAKANAALEASGRRFDAPPLELAREIMHIMRREQALLYRKP